MSRDSKSSHDSQIKTINESLSKIILLFNELKNDFGVNISTEDFIEVLNLISNQRKIMMESLFFRVAKIAYSTEERSEEENIIKEILLKYFENNPLIKKYFLTDGNRDIFEYYASIENLTESKDIEQANIPIMLRAIKKIERDIGGIENSLRINKAKESQLTKKMDEIDKQRERAAKKYAAIKSEFEYYDSLMKKYGEICKEIEELPFKKEGLSDQYYEYEDRISEIEEYVEELGYSEEEIRDKIIEIEENQEASDKVAQDTDYNALDDLQEKLGAILSAKKDMASYISAKEEIEKAIERIDKRYNRLLIDFENINEEAEIYNISEIQEDINISQSHLIELIKVKNEYSLLLLSNRSRIGQNYIDLDNNSKTLENLQHRKADYLLNIMLDLDIDNTGITKILQEQSERFQYILDLRYPDGSNLLERLCQEDQNEPVTNKLITKVEKFTRFLVTISLNNLGNLSEYIGSSNINIGQIKKELLDYVNQISTSLARPGEEKEMQPRDDAGQEIPAKQEDLQEQGGQQDTVSTPQSQATPLESEKLNGREENSQKR